MPDPSQIFLSIVMVVRDDEAALDDRIASAVEVARGCAEDFEIIVVDNGSTDGSVGVLRALCHERDVPNLQVFVLTQTEGVATAAWAGIENALGDYVAVINPMLDDIAELPRLVEAALGGADVVFAENLRPRRRSMGYRLADRVFSGAARQFLNIDPRRDLPSYRLMSRRLVNYLMQRDASGASYSWLPAASGFRKETIRYASAGTGPPRNLPRDIDRGIQILVSSTAGPMRLVTLLSLFGAVANLLYSVYVIGVALFKEDVAPGWVTLSLQQSGMFLLLSLVLLILGEYVLQVLRSARNAPGYHIAEEFGSAVITRRQRLNVDVGDEGLRLNAAMLRPKGHTTARAGGQ